MNANVLSHRESEEIREKLKWLMGLRVLVVTILMGTPIILEIGPSRALWSLPTFSLMIAFTYFLTIVYALTLKRTRRLVWFAYCQIAVDIGLETLLVSATGGRYSPFTFLYLFSIIASSMILGRRGGMSTAFAASLLYGFAGDLQYYGYISVELGTIQAREAFYALLLNVGAFLAVAFLSSNLTEKLKQARRSLKEKEAGLATLRVFHENVVQSMSSGLLTADLEGRITSFNRAAQAITGRSWEDVRGRRIEDVLEDPQLGQFYRRPDQMKTPVRYDVRSRRNDGSRLLLGVTLSPLKDESGQVAGVVGTFQDVTQIREMEEEMWKRRKLAMVGEVAAGMAHEIRNPLAAVSGSLQVLSRELKLEEDYLRLMDIALKEMDRLNHIVTEFLYYARPSPPNFKCCDLVELIQETVGLFQSHKAGEQPVRIQMNFPNGRLQAEVDPAQMKQVFWNLLINAAQAMPVGGDLIVTARMRERNYAEIAFEDHGVGIPESVRDRIFDPFFTTKTNGSGLGLPIVQRIIEEHRGNIRVDSEPGRGTRIRILLPVPATGEDDLEMPR